MNWTSEQYEAHQQRQLAKRLNAQAARSYSSPIIDELCEGVTERDLDRTERRMMKAGEKENEEVWAELSGKKKPKSKKQNPEYHIQADFVRKMAERYPLIMVFSDTAAHIKKTVFQQVRANKLQSEVAKGWPDVFVAQPSGKFAGLFLEFKAKSPYLKDGLTLSSDKHIRAQAATMDRLRERGYACAFVWEASQAFNLTNKYLNL